MRTGTPAQKDHAMSTETWGRTCCVRGGKEVTRERGGREVTRGSLRARPYQHARVHALAHTHTIVFSTLPSHITPPLAHPAASPPEGGENVVVAAVVTGSGERVYRALVVNLRLPCWRDGGG